MKSMEWTAKDVASYPHLLPRVKRKLGLGRLSTYRPWLGLRDKPGKGTVGVPKGLVTGRTHQFRTLAARTYGLLLERREEVVDIRELFPIFDIERTLKICGQWGYEHTYEGVNVEPFLIDFVITVRQGDQCIDVARSLMPSSGKLGRKLAESFRVQHEWCQQMSVSWGRVDSKGLNQKLLDSLLFVRQWTKNGYEPDPKTAARFADLFRRVHEPHRTLMDIVERCASKSGESYDRCLDHFRYVAWRNVLKVDLLKPVILNQPVMLLSDG